MESISVLIQKAFDQKKLRYAKDRLDLTGNEVNLELNRTGMSGVEFIYRPATDSIIAAWQTIDGVDLEIDAFIDELARVVGEDPKDYIEVIQSGEFDDEFPDEHSHVPQEVAPDTLGLHFADSEGRHYYLQHKVTDDGIVVDVYDRYGDELQATWTKTWEELGEWVQDNYPTPEFIPKKTPAQRYLVIQKTLIDATSEEEAIELVVNNVKAGNQAIVEQTAFPSWGELTRYRVGIVNNFAADDEDHAIEQFADSILSSPPIDGSLIKGAINIIEVIEEDE